MTRRAPWLLAVGGLVLYLLSGSYLQMDGDAVRETRLMFAADIDVWRAYHLLQTPLNRAVLGLFQNLGYHGPDFVSLQVLNAICGAITLALLWHLCLRLGCRPKVAAAATVLFAVCQTPWFHSRTAETAVTPMPLVLAAFLLLLPTAPLARRQALIRAALAAVAMAGAMLLSLNLLVLLPALFLAAARLDRDRGWRWDLPLIALAVGFMVMGAAFGYAIQRLGLTGNSIVDWFLHHEDSAGVAAAGGGVFGLLRSIAGLGRAFFPVSAGETGVKALLRGEQVALGFADVYTLCRNLGTVVVCLALAFLGWRRLRGTLAGGIVGTAVITSVVFNLVWLGSDPQFWLPPLPFLFAAGAVAVQDRAAPNRARGILYGLTFLLLFATNLPNTVPSPLWPFWGATWQRARQAAEVLPDGAVVLVAGDAPLRLLTELRDDIQIVDLMYGAPGEVQGARFTSWLTRRIDRALAEGRTVWIEGLREPLAPDMLGWWDMVRGTHGLDHREIAELLDARYRLTAADGLPDGVERIE